jgi:hypothetical protein
MIVLKDTSQQFSSPTTSGKAKTFTKQAIISKPKAMVKGVLWSLQNPKLKALLEDLRSQISDLTCLREQRTALDGFKGPARTKHPHSSSPKSLLAITESRKASGRLYQAITATSKCHCHSFGIELFSDTSQGSGDSAPRDSQYQLLVSSISDTTSFTLLLPACRSPCSSMTHGACSIKPSMCGGHDCFPSAIYVSSIMQFSVFLLFLQSIEPSIFHLSRFVLSMMPLCVLLSLQSLQHVISTTLPTSTSPPCFPFYFFKFIIHYSTSFTLPNYRRSKTTTSHPLHTYVYPSSPFTDSPVGMQLIMMKVSMYNTGHAKTKYLTYANYWLWQNQIVTVLVAKELLTLIPGESTRPNNIGDA